MFVRKYKLQKNCIFCMLRDFCVSFVDFSWIGIWAHFKLDKMLNKLGRPSVIIPPPFDKGKHVQFQI